MDAPIQALRNMGLDFTHKFSSETDSDAKERNSLWEAKHKHTHMRPAAGSRNALHPCSTPAANQACRRRHHRQQRCR